MHSSCGQQCCLNVSTKNIALKPRPVLSCKCWCWSSGGRSLVVAGCYLSCVDVSLFSDLCSWWFKKTGRTTTTSLNHQEHRSLNKLTLTHDKQHPATTKLCLPRLQPSTKQQWLQHLQVNTGRGLYAVLSVDTSKQYCWPQLECNSNSQGIYITKTTTPSTWQQRTQLECSIILRRIYTVSSTMAPMWRH